MITKDMGYHPNVFMELNKFREMNGIPIYLKLEGFSLSGSIKHKPALYMIEQLEEKGMIQAGRNSIIESSSGNLAIALAQICHSKGYHFTAVVDKNTTNEVHSLLRLYGAEVIIVEVPDENGGYLESRIRKINEIITNDPACFWINQYANIDNINAHYFTTAPEILEDFPAPTYIFVGAGTTGTLNGIRKYFNEFCPSTKIIAVDAAGSVTFSQPASTRFIPGIGTSRVPEIATLLNGNQPNDILWISEIDTIRMCHRILDEYSVAMGGSTGSVVAAIIAYADRFKTGDTIIGISPDFGGKYLDTIYNPAWVAQKYQITIK